MDPAPTHWLTGESATPELASASPVWTTEALDALPVGISITDERGIILYTNAAEDRLFGYERGELAGQHVSVQNSYTPEENARRVDEVIDHLQHRGEWQGQWCNRRKDGTVFYTFARIVATQMTAGKCWLCMQEEVAGDPRLQDQFQILADSIANLAWMAHADGHVFWFNRRWYDYIGTRPRDVAGWDWTAVIHPDSVENAVAGWSASVRTGQPFEMVIQLKGGDGRFRPFLTRIVPLFDSAGNVDRWFGTSTDISAQIEAETALRTTEERLLRIVEASGRLLGSMSVSQVVSDTLSLAPGLVPCDAVAIWRENDDRTWSIAACHGLSDAYQQASLRVQGPALGDQLLVIGDVTADSPNSSRLPSYAQEGIRAMLGAPLRIRGGLSGTLMFYFHSVREFTPSECEIVRALGNVAAAALTSAEVYEREAKTRRDAEAGERRAGFIARAGAILHASLDMDVAVAEVAELAVGQVTDYVRIELHSTPAGPAVFEAGDSAAFAQRIEAPLIVGEQPAGRIVFGRPGEAEPWPVEDRALLLELARRVAIALENTRLHLGIREASERAHLAMAAAELGTWDFDTIAGTLTWSARTRDIFGIDAEGPVSRELFYSLVHPEDHDRVRESMLQATSPGIEASAHVEYRITRPDGSIRWVISAGRGLFEGVGHARRAVRVIGIVRDNTASRLAEEERTALLAREQEARSTAELLNRVGPLLLSELNRERLVQKFVDICTRLVGAATGALTGDFVVWEVMRVADCHVDPSFASSPPLGNTQIRSLLAVPVNAQTGESFGTLVFGHPAPGRFGQREEQLATGIAAQAAIALDNARLFAEALRVQEALHKANLSLRAANTDLEQFAFAAAHDLREPLRMVTSYTQLLERDLGPALGEKAKGFMEQVINGATRMSDLLQDLLSYTNTATQYEPAGRLDLNAVVTNVVQNLGAAIAETSAEIEVDTLPAISGRSGHMVLVFQNLIGNAIKYRRAGVRPRIEIGAERQESGWLIRIADNGIGIAPQYQNQIFGVFKRLHGREIPGTGIGLAICQRAIERGGGKIWVESTPGEGSTFLFTVPAREAPEE